MGDLVTVVVPVYNVENYIEKCVDSILAQSYKNLEIILVDDGSNDRSGKISDRYAENDARIKVIHKENGGLSDARNAAIERAKGKYITFVDSDDYIEKDYVEYLYRLLKDNNADMSICSINNLTPNEKEISCYNSGKIIIMDRKQALFELLNSKKYTNSASAKLFKTEHFRDIRFPVGRIYEDVATIYKTFLLCDKIVFGERALYNYIHHQGTISRQKFTPARLDAIEFCYLMTGEITKIYPELKRIADCRCFDSYITLLKVVNKSENSEIYSEAWKNLKLKRKTVITYIHSGLKRKIRAVASYFGRII